MKMIFFLIRLPCFFILIVAYTLMLCFKVPLFVVFWIFFLPIIWSLSIPFVFLSAAFSNDFDIFASHIKRAREGWIEGIKECLIEITEFYKNATTWLKKGGEAPDI